MLQYILVYDITLTLRYDKLYMFYMYLLCFVCLSLEVPGPLVGCRLCGGATLALEAQQGSLPDDRRVWHGQLHAQNFGTSRHGRIGMLEKMGLELGPV